MPVTNCSRLAQQPAFLPVLVAEERHHRAVAGARPLGDDQRIDAGQHAVDVGVAVAGAGLARLDAAAHRAGVADDDARSAAGRSALGRSDRSSVTRLSLRGQDRRAHPVGRRRHLADGDAGGVADGVEDGRRGRDQRRLADALGAERAERLRRPRSGWSRSPGTSPTVGIR